MLEQVASQQLVNSALSAVTERQVNTMGPPPAMDVKDSSGDQSERTTFIHAGLTETV